MIGPCGLVRVSSLYLEHIKMWPQQRQSQLVSQHFLVSSDFSSQSELSACNSVWQQDCPPPISIEMLKPIVLLQISRSNMDTFKILTNQS